MDTNNLEQDLYYINEKDDFGCIVGCALTDTLQEIISSLVGGYSVLELYEKESSSPDTEKVRSWDKRGNEIFAHRNLIAKSDKTYNDIRNWISIYSEELIQLNKLRDQYENPA